MDDSVVLFGAVRRPSLNGCQCGAQLMGGVAVRRPAPLPYRAAMAGLAGISPAASYANAGCICGVRLPQTGPAYVGVYQAGVPHKQAKAMRPFALAAVAPPPLSAQAKSLKQELCGNPWADWIAEILSLGLDLLLPGADSTGLGALEQAINEIPSLCFSGDLQPPSGDLCAVLYPHMTVTSGTKSTTTAAPNPAFAVWSAFNALRTAPALPGRLIGAIADAVTLMGAACGSPDFGRQIYQGRQFSLIARELLPTAPLSTGITPTSAGVGAGAAVGIGVLALLLLR